MGWGLLEKFFKFEEEIEYFNEFLQTFSYFKNEVELFGFFPILGTAFWIGNSRGQQK